MRILPAASILPAILCVEVSVFDAGIMSCLQPLRAYPRKSGRDPLSGKWSLTFRKSEGYIDLAMDIPCGKCLQCRLDQARTWSLRCMHESRLHEHNCAITLTYADDFLPVSGLDKRKIQNWFKILRNNIGSVRYFGCGEYGDQFRRPHYHIMLFGFDFPDKKLITNHGGARYYDSPLLRKLWPYGHSTVGDLTPQTAAYISRYVLKKQTNPEEFPPDLTPEYTFMSNRPGIGKDFAVRYCSDFMALDACIIDGKKYKIPKYYESVLSEHDLKGLKARRQLYALEHPVTQTTALRFESVQTLLNTYKRSYENV